MRRWFTALVLASMALPACGGGGGGSSPSVVADRDEVLVQMWGSATVHNAPGGDISGNVTYQFQEVAIYDVGEGNIVDDSSRDDQLRGSGTVTAYSPLYGHCTARYDVPAESTGTVGIRVINEGQDVKAIGLAPWSLHTVTDYEGPYCGQATDPAGGLLDGLDLASVGSFSCVLAANDTCTKSTPVPASTSPAITQSGTVSFEAHRSTHFRDRSMDALLDDALGFLDELLDVISWAPLLASGFHDGAVPTSGLGPAPADGSISIDVSHDGDRLGQVRGTAQKGEVPTLTGTWDRAAVKSLDGATDAIPLTLAVTYDPPGGAPLELTQTVFVPAATEVSPTAPSTTTPASTPSTTVPASVPTITAVAFSGSASDPTIVVTGRNLGAQPPASPAGHPSGQGGCPSVADDDGYDYGTSLYIAVPSRGWSAGRYDPSANETDCFDVVVTAFSPTEVRLRLGSPYRRQTADQLSAGTPYQIVVNGATSSGTVAYS